MYINTYAYIYIHTYTLYIYIYIDIDIDIDRYIRTQVGDQTNANSPGAFIALVVVRPTSKP